MYAHIKRSVCNANGILPVVATPYLPESHNSVQSACAPTSHRYWRRLRNEADAADAMGVIRLPTHTVCATVPVTAPVGVWSE